jgi:hypothetical protein
MFSGRGGRGKQPTLQTPWYIMNEDTTYDKQNMSVVICGTDMPSRLTKPYNSDRKLFEVMTSA